ncbi:PREDICTED: hepatic lectin-like, partial [Tauraco erythrolophus]|uniref:hepatic lectin-like n=1 Tax=Tauraco erythrolophus TaxID=121530 RepID=UPI0005236EDA
LLPKCSPSRMKKPERNTSPCQGEVLGGNPWRTGGNATAHPTSLRLSLTVSAISSKLHEVHPEWNQNFSSRDSLLFPCGPNSREWEYFDGKCYYFSLTRTSWHKAKAWCEEMHSQLAVINSFAKQNFIMFRTRNERFWIGLTDENSEGEWRWIDGTDYKSTFTFWKEGEPNDSGRNEDCAHVWLSGKWNDVYCTYECYYVCEKPLPN